MTDSAAETMIQQAYDQMKQGYFQDAIETFSACLVIEPNETKALRGRGWSHFRIKNWSSAVKDFSAAKEIDPKDPENRLGLGMSLAMMNEVYPAMDIFQNLISEKSDYGQAYIQLGLIYLKIGAISKGKENLKKALECRLSLEERRTIDSLLSEQEKLDKNRYYRPDFELLRRQNPGFHMMDFFKKLKSFFKKSDA